MQLILCGGEMRFQWETEGYCIHIPLVLWPAASDVTFSTLFVKLGEFLTNH